MTAILDYIRSNREDRGFMANLRCALVEEKKSRAWPILGRFNLIDNQVAHVVIGLFATHPLESKTGNLGTTCKQIDALKGNKGNSDEKVSPMERRFLGLLASDSAEEASQRVLRVILVAKAEGIPVNYDQLFTDLAHWGDYVRRSWAKSFWTPVTVEKGEEGNA